MATQKPDLKTITAMNEEEQSLLKSSYRSVNESFEDIAKTARLNFIRKVYLLLLYQLAITCSFVVATVQSDRIRLFVQTYYFVYVLAVVLSLICIYALVCFIDFQRKVPHNYIVFTLFTICEAYIVSYICSFFPATSVLLAGLLTMGVVASLTCYAFTTTTDFTNSGAFLFMLLVTLSIGSIVGYYLRFEPLRVGLNILAVLLFGGYLIYDTQLLLGSKAVSFSVDDYIAATVNIYIDIIQLFLEILQFFGKAKDQ